MSHWPRHSLNTLDNGLPGLRGRDGAAVWGQEFLFAVESDAPAFVSIDKPPPVPMRQVAGTKYWYKLATLRLGTTHQYVYSAAGRNLGAYEVAGVTIPILIRGPA